MCHVWWLISYGPWTQKRFDSFSSLFLQKSFSSLGFFFEIKLIGILIQAHLGSFWLRGIMAKEKKMHAHRCVLTCIKEKGGSEKHQASKLVKGSGMDLFLFSDMQKFSNVGESLQKSWAFYADACFLLFGCQRMNGHIHKITSRQQSLQQRMAEPVGLTKVTERQLTENYS